MSVILSNCAGIFLLEHVCVYQRNQKFGRASLLPSTGVKVGAYEMQVNSQVHDVTEKKGVGDLQKLVTGRDTWTVQ